MSWLRSYEINKTILDNELEVGSVFEQLGDHQEASEDQYIFGKELARSIIHSGVVGDISKHKFRVQLSGHANPNHEKTEGWANDMLTISVSQGDDK